MSRIPQLEAFVLNEATTFAEKTQNGIDAIDVKQPKMNILAEDEEMFKLILLYSNPRPFVHRNPEPESRKSIRGLAITSTIILPPPAIFRRKK